MSSKYYDTSAVINIIGNIYLHPSLLDETDKYNIIEEDFDKDFHKVVYGSIYKIYELGAQKITLETINDFLAERPKYQQIYKQNKGDEWITKAIQSVDKSTFDYYYNRLKKMSLLRAYDNYGVDVKFIYDPDNFLDVEKHQLQEEWLDNNTLETIAQRVDDKIEEVKAVYVDDCSGEAVQAGDGIFDLLDRLEKSPDVGVPMYGPYINAVTRGARLRKFYLRSLASGYGKSRMMIADICNIACNKIYMSEFGSWISNGTSQPALYISVEQEKDEIQTMMLAFLSDVNEEHIINGHYEGDEKDRVQEAAKILAASPLYIEELPDFGLKDVENTIKKNIREHDVKYVGFDYILTSLKILSDISKASNIRIREDNVLFMLSARLKDLCNQYGIWIISSTQLNSDWRESETPDQNLLRGAKAIADRIDVGMIGLPITQKDLDGINPILASNSFDVPNMKLSIYKNRRGRYKGVYLWCKADLGTCRVKAMFCTKWDYTVEPINDLKINVDEPSAFGDK